MILKYKMKKIKEIFGKGEITSTAVVSIVILIIGFGAILFIYSQLDWNENVDRSVCSQSVAVRGSFFDEFGVSTKDIVPLKCQTRKVCISDKKEGDCDFIGEYETVKIDSSVDKIDNQIKMALAREMADCWKMMGGGKIQIFSRDWFSGSKKGVVCSRIDFDNSIKEKKGTIQGLTQYLYSHKIPGREESYWTFLTREDYSKNLFIEEGKNLPDEDSFDLSQKAILFVEMDQSYLGGAIGSSLGLMGGAYVGSAIGSAVPVVGTGVGFVVGGAIAGGLTLLGGYTQERFEKETFKGEKFVSGQFFIDYSTENIRAFNSDSLENIA